MISPLIDLTNVQFRWQDGADLVLDIPAFAVAEGERVFLEGPSGSGKTTLLNLLGGVTTPETGQVMIGGTDLRSLSGAGRDRFRADNIGFIFQMFNLIPYLSLIDNVALPCRFSNRRADGAVARSGGILSDAHRLLEQVGLGKEARDGRASTDLSTGQQQRVAMARALIGAPRLVVADEPTSALDHDVRKTFMDLLFQEVSDAGATLLFVSHDPDLAAPFDRRVALASINQVGGA